VSKRWLVLDAPYLFYRSFYAMGNLSWDGDTTGVIFGFLRDLIYFQEMHMTTGTVFCFDQGKPLRKDLFPGYKAKRELERSQLSPQDRNLRRDFLKQIHSLRDELLTQIGFRNVLTKEGYEADDHIAAVCRSTQDEFVVVGSDHDLFQILSHNISIWNPHKKEMVTHQSFTRRYGIRPRQWIRVKALAGCGTDNIPGVSGVGEITAIKYLRGELRPGKVLTKIENGQDVVERNLPLVRLPFPDTPTPHLHNDNIRVRRWEELADRLGMKTLRDRPPGKTRTIPRGFLRDSPRGLVRRNTDANS
jgi:DNA polymerase-1